MTENRSSRAPVAIGALSGLVAAVLMTFVQAVLRLGLGEHRLLVRAVDGTGAAQIDKDKTSGPEGATGLHRVTAQIA